MSDWNSALADTMDNAWGFDTMNYMDQNAINANDISSSVGQGANDGFFGDAFSNFDNTMGSVSKLAGIGASIFQSYVGLQGLKIAKEELGIKKEKWAEAKRELNWMRNTRHKLTNKYMGRSSGNAPTSGQVNAAMSKF